MTHNRLRGAGGDQNRNLFVSLVALFGTLAISISVSAQTLDLPWGPVKRLASPDGSKILYGVPYQEGRNEGPSLWMEDEGTRGRTKLFDIGSTLTAAWSPDGSAFYVNNHWASDREQAYIYDAATMRRLDIGARIQSADSQSRGLATGHTYFRVTGWEGTEQVAVSFFGHTDEPPVLCFTLRYRVNKAGVVTKLSQRITPATAKFCDESP
jgi:hypothetical protein